MPKTTDYTDSSKKTNTSAKAGILCMEIDAQQSRNFLDDESRLPYYSYSIITQGQATIRYNGKELTLHRNDFYTYTVGYPITIIDISDDYHVCTLFIEDGQTLEAPVLRNMLRAAYFPFVELQDPYLALSDTDAEFLLDQMHNMMAHQTDTHLFRTDVMRQLYAAFMLDLMNIMERTVIHHRTSERAEELFIEFIRLLPQHFVDHHDIPFYADRLCVTPIYLSRIVRQVSGRTVMDYINQMLLAEASWMLRSSSLTTTQIADLLNFSSQSSFCRFFTRLKGVSPKNYRTRH